MKMKTARTMLALLLLSVFVATGCATISPPAGEHEEELTSEETAAFEKKLAEEREDLRWQDYRDDE
jgi:hypothetical protein